MLTIVGAGPPPWLVARGRAPGTPRKLFTTTSSGDRSRRDRPCTLPAWLRTGINTYSASEPDERRERGIFLFFVGAVTYGTIDDLTGIVSQLPLVALVARTRLRPSKGEPNRLSRAKQSSKQKNRHPANERTPPASCSALSVDCGQIGSGHTWQFGAVRWRWGGKAQRPTAKTWLSRE